MSENWEDGSGFPIKKILLVVLLVGLLVGVSYAVYKITSPPSEPVHVSEPALLSKPTTNTTECVTGDIVQISTTLNDAASGVQVFFYENDISLGYAYTNAEGTAIYNRVVNTPGTYVYTADCIHP